MTSDLLIALMLASHCKTRDTPRGADAVVRCHCHTVSPSLLLSVLLPCSHLSDAECPNLKATDEDYFSLEIRPISFPAGGVHHVDAVGSYKADKVDEELEFRMPPRPSVVVRLLAFLRE